MEAPIPSRTAFAALIVAGGLLVGCGGGSSQPREADTGSTGASAPAASGPEPAPAQVEARGKAPGGGASTPKPGARMTGASATGGKATGGKAAATAPKTGSAGVSLPASSPAVRHALRSLAHDTPANDTVRRNVKKLLEQLKDGDTEAPSPAADVGEEAIEEVLQTLK